MTEAERAALAAYPGLRRLAALRDSGTWQFLHRVDDRGVNLSVGFRIWRDGSADALGFLSLTDAQAWRTNPGGAMVWAREGDLVDVVEGLLELPAPDHPGAPRLIIPAPKPRFWTP